MKSKLINNNNIPPLGVSKMLKYFTQYLVQTEMVETEGLKQISDFKYNKMKTKQNEFSIFGIEFFYILLMFSV